MLSENLKALRTAKGYSQEELASRLHVVRQTVSKWEKGLSVPDADLLLKLADILETDVATLLGAAIETKEDQQAIAQQLSAIAEQMAIKNRRSRLIWKIVIFVIAAYLILNILSVAAFTALPAEPTIYEESFQINP